MDDDDDGDMISTVVNDLRTSSEFPSLVVGVTELSTNVETSSQSKDDMTETSVPLPTGSMTASDPDGDDDTDETNIGAIVGGVVGGLAFIVSGLLLLAFWWRRRRKRAQFAGPAALEAKPSDDVAFSDHPDVPQLEGTPVIDKPMWATPVGHAPANMTPQSDAAQLHGDSARIMGAEATPTAVSAHLHAAELHSDEARCLSVGAMSTTALDQPHASQLHGDSVQTPSIGSFSIATSPPAHASQLHSDSLKNPGINFSPSEASGSAGAAQLHGDAMQKSNAGQLPVLAQLRSDKSQSDKNSERPATR